MFKKFLDRFPLAGGLLAGVVFFVTLPVMFPVAMFQHRRGLLRRRIVRDLHALCVACHAEYRYDEKHALFALRMAQQAVSAPYKIIN